MTATAPLPLSYAEPATPKVRAERLTSLDVFRGATLAMMLLVNNAGDGKYVYGPLEHAPWDGCTPTDLVFPFFLFIVGVAIPFSIASRRAKGASESSLVLNTLRRTAILFGLGVFLNAIPFKPHSGFLDPAHLRIPGVLQRIALCYLPAALLTLSMRWRGRVVTGVLLLAVYAWLMLCVPVPGYGRGVLTADGSLASHVDRVLLGAHTYRANYDPEGLLSTLPAIVTALIGTLAGDWLRRSDRAPVERSAGLFAGGVACAVAGYVLSLALMPINKALWTPSYVMLTAGYALLGLGLCHWVVDVHGWRRWATPWIVFGVNPIVAFVAAGVLGRLLLLIRWTGADHSTVTLRVWLYSHLFAPLASPINASLLWAVCYVAAFGVVLGILYRKGIYVRV